ncbi:MAG TPA: glycosyltransferase family 39 protein, partial [Thermoanaerobaculia bacterium]|nr:glycosyltransferase family 39 protein [Thermoanaerobaculia bacterium]
MPSSPGQRRRLRLIAVLALALLVRLGHWWAVREAPFVASLAVDAEEYDAWARRLAAGDWLGEETFFQAPLYPYLLGGLYRAVGRHLGAVYLLQILAAVAGCWALYRAGRTMAGERVGLAAAALFALYGPFVFYDVQLAKESLAVTAVCFLLWTLAAARAGGRAALWLAAGALLGLLALLRENALLLVPFLLPLAWSRAGGRAGFARRAAALLLGLALALAPVALRNRAVGGGALPTTFQGGVNLWIGNNPDADGTYRPLVPGRLVPALERRAPVALAERAAGRRLTPAEVSGFWARRALAWAAERPADALRLQLRKLAMFWSWYEWPDAVDYYYLRRLSPPLWLAFVEFGAVSLLALIGLALWMTRRRGTSAALPPALAPALLWIIGWTAATVVFFLFSRYRLPAMPAVLLLAALPLAAA